MNRSTRAALAHCRSRGRHPAKFCKFMKVERIEDIPQRDFDKARLALEAKQAKS
jgi:hypothetical protein